MFPTLYQFFRHQLQHGFHVHGFTEPCTVDYISEVLTRFSQTRRLYPVFDAEGRPLERIVDFLATSRLTQDCNSGTMNYTQGKFIIRHIGEYALFMSGIFRERLEAHGQLNYFLAHGRSAFWRSADYESDKRRREVYRRLYYHFEPISNILDYVRRVQFPLTVPATAENMLATFWRV